MLKQQADDARTGFGHPTHDDFSIHRDRESWLPPANDLELLHIARRPAASPKLAPARSLSMNAANNASNGAHNQNDRQRPLPPTELRLPASASSGKMVSTIRPVRTSEEKENQVDYAPSDNARSSPPLAARESAVSGSVSGAAGRASIKGDREQQSPRVGAYSPTVAARSRPSPSAVGSSPELAIDIPRRESSRVGAGNLPPYGPPAALSASGGMRSVSTTSENGVDPSSFGLLAPAETPPANGWDSTVGKAGLGKTGRVINRLVSDNEALKRDIQIERLRAEESRQAARLVEDKMDRLVSDFEGRLLEANVTKTLLARKERQVESLQAAVEAERKRAIDARERERMWKEEMERVRDDAKRQVEDAAGRAALMEGRYNAISSHWRDQGDEVRRTVSEMGRQVAELGDERRADDERIATLRDLCDQQDGNIRELMRQKEDIATQFDAYKLEQEEALRDIQAKAAEREGEQETMLSDAKEVLDKLKWALAVKENVPWAR